MEIIKRNTIVIGASVLPRHVEMIEHLIQDKGTFKSKSEVIQRALEFFHDKTYPAYVFNLSPAAAAKKKAADDASAFEKMSPKEFSDSVKAKIFTHSNGNQYSVFWAWFNALRSTPLSEIKEMFSNAPDLYDLSTLPGNTPIPESFTDNELIKMLI